MAGNRRLYEHAVRTAQRYYTDKAWDKALAEYQNANPRHLQVISLDYTRSLGEARALLVE